MIFALVLIPVIAAVLAMLIRSDVLCRGVLVLTAAVHAGLTGWAWIARPEPVMKGWLAIDDLGLLFLSIVSLLFLTATIYAVGYLRNEHGGEQEDMEEGFLFNNAPEARFTGCLLMFLATMTLVTVSRHLGLLWVAVEATTLASAPLIYFHRHHRSLEATWKYLLICSVGIALALLGNFFLVVAASVPESGSVSLMLSDLIGLGEKMQTPWLKAAFLFLLVGYGTKMGLAPLHTWLPDAHSESPSVVSALLSGALLNCAFLGILRGHQICRAAGLEMFSRDLLILFGLISIGWAAVFILNQADYKRMLAYSSVEHMGILALGVGVGGGAIFGAMLHAVNHSLTKAMLFLVAGNILAAYKTKSTADVRGVVRALPISGVLWVAGFLAITGMPPFGIFMSKLTIIKAMLDQGRGWMTAGFLGMLAVIFVGMSATMLKMAQGRAPEMRLGEMKSEKIWSLVPPAILSVLILILGLYIPPVVSEVLGDVAKALGGE